MGVSHHLADETLQDHAAGVLSQAMETLIACHLTVCPRCRNRLQVAESLGGNVLEGSESARVRLSALDALARARSTLEGQHTNGSLGSEAVEPSHARARVANPGVPAPLGRLLPAPLETLEWKRMAPGIRQHNLGNWPRQEGAFKLLLLEPGVVLSQHTHNDRELTFVVKGSYQDEIGRFRAGDVADLDEQDIHRPVVDTDEPCIALIATDSPVRYSGMLGKIMQPFVGI